MLPISWTLKTAARLPPAPSNLPLIGKNFSANLFSNFLFRDVAAQQILALLWRQKAILSPSLHTRFLHPISSRCILQQGGKDERHVSRLRQEGVSARGAGIGALSF